MVPTNCFADPKLGSISSLRCQKSRRRIPKDATCEVMFRGRDYSRQLFRSSIPSGGARRDRTDDLMLAKHALSQLSYGPECNAAKRGCLVRMVGLGRLELPTSRLSSARSNQLSYKPDEASSSGLAAHWRKTTTEKGRKTRTAARRQLF